MSRFFLLLAGLLALSGCGGGRPIVWQEAGVDLVWPPPPEPPRISYLRSLSGPADFQGENKTGRAFRWLLGDDGQDWPLLAPYAVAPDDGGLLWVADSGARMLYRFDLLRGRVDYIQESNGVRLVTPSGVAVDSPGRRVFVADADLAKILVFDLEGQLLEQWAPPEGFRRPAGLALDGSRRLYAADVMAGQIFVFGPDGNVVGRRGSRVSSDGLFRRPVSIAIGPRDELLVNESMGFQVEVQDARGELLGTIGRLGDGPGMFARPRGLAVSREGHVFVTDAAFDNVQVFDLAGRLLLHFGSAGSGPGQFNLPAGLALDREGRLFVADSYNHRIQVFQFTPDGKR
ncbi:MAG: 6-bladed beta-propeller [Deltaproteobacteria bacterium]|nr:MAG: 6-bladed beta-propeller [Deltaproteobacteria bacterium]